MHKEINIKPKKKKEEEETKKEKVESPKDIEPNTCRERNNGGREKELWGHQRQEGVWLSPIYSKKAHRIDQIRELRERERCWSKYYSLSLSLSKFCHVWEVLACCDRVCNIPRFFF